MLEDNKWCENCRYWLPFIRGEGECRRYPPMVNQTDKRTSLITWPHTGGSGWCGEWAAKSKSNIRRTS